MIKLLTVLLITISTLTFAKPQIDHDFLKSDTGYTYSKVDTEPVPKKGMETLYKKWSSYGKYPLEARKKGIEGKVYVSLVIDKKGKMTDLKVIKGLGSGCDEAAIEALLNTKTKWIPGRNGGKRVKVNLVLPFTFRLN